jgi:quinolinate synthase
MVAVAFFFRRLMLTVSINAVEARLRSRLPDIEWQVHAPLIAAIDALKRQRRAVILAHNYQTPEIFHGVADLTGDSLQLAREAAATDAEVIVLAGVHFMAETAKILNPDKIVLIPDANAGCSLAESISAEDVRRLKARHPDVPVVTYVNTSADVKAESDICCTSANAVQVVESLGVPRVIFLPDEFLGRWVASQTDVDVILWRGHCEVHERFTGTDLRSLRASYGDLQILAHPECPPDVLAEADFVGSTAGMVAHVGRVRPRRVALITECSMSDNVALEFPELEFVRPCNLCPHMKRITLPAIHEALTTMQHRVEIAPDIAARARGSVERMLAVTNQPARLGTSA